VRSGTIAGGTISLSAAGKFQLDFTAASAWQPTRWFDLATSISLDLANKNGGGLGYNVLNAPVEFQLNGSWYNLSHASNATATIIEENESRVVLRTQYHMLPTGSDFFVQTDYTVYASGRVAVNMTLQNQSGASRTLGAVEYAFMNVEDALAWTITPLSSNHAIAFQRSGHNHRYRWHREPLLDRLKSDPGRKRGVQPPVGAPVGAWGTNDDKPYCARRRRARSGHHRRKRRHHNW
jgi:hypothetical protein